ncbi:MAG: hypothetical protein HQL26_02495 [Candidatus Omnitrophica bacterium]|nr:hypothetical protein [Candidatus Omnitrophota bacterium]
MKRLMGFLIALGFLSAAAGCGYTTAGALPSNYHTLWVKNFENKVQFTTDVGQSNYFPLLEVKAHDAIIRRFLFDGHLKGAHEDSADLILTGVLKSYEKKPLRFTDNEDVQEYRVYITVALELTERETGKVVWTEPSFTGEGTYLLQGTVSPNVAGSEQGAVDLAIQDLANRVVERTIENW